MDWKPDDYAGTHAAKHAASASRFEIKVISLPNFGRDLAIGWYLWETLGMTKLTPKKKAKRQEVRSERKAAKQQRKDLRELEQRSEPRT
jgi:hypothetical protein